MENKEFEIGDVVELKSGSPKMTILYLEPAFVTAVLWDNIKNDIVKVTVEKSVLKLSEV